MIPMLRERHPDNPMYTFWSYWRNRYGGTPASASTICFSAPRCGRASRMPALIARFAVSRTRATMLPRG
ncbi:MAG: hypothetical protein JWR89_3454 [Tardiphaga sp.]|jgi:hypothetical protein|nr:hypothetical protein [Tardiphaga sp.]